MARWVFVSWAVTRLVVFAAMWIAAPHHLVTALQNWDGAWYGSIAKDGYSFPHAIGHSPYGFFPLFPLLGAGIMRLHLAWPIAGAIVNNAAFLAALIVLYRFVEGRAGSAAARWTVVVTCVLPYSLFGAVAYAEGLFMLCSAAALYAYDRERYLVAGIAAALASLARPPGVALAAALVAAAIVERRGARAIGACALGFGGIAAFAGWCAWQTGDPLAFAHAEKAWRGTLGFDWVAWWAQLRRDFGTTSLAVWRADGMLWLMLLGGAAALLSMRARLGRPALYFALCCLLALPLSGTPFSVDRYLYAVIPILAAFGMCAARFPIAGGAAVLVCVPWLAYDAWTFAQFHWVA